MSPETNFSAGNADQAELAALKFALASANIGTWDLKLTLPMTSVWDDRCRQIFGVGDTNEMDYTNSVDFIFPADREMVDKAVKTALSGANDGNYNVTYRTASDENRWVNTIGKVYFNDSHSPVRFAGIAIDATEQVQKQQQLARAKKAEEELASTKGTFGTLVQQAPMAIAQLNGPDLVIETANEAILKIWHMDQSALGKPIAGVITDPRGEPFIMRLRRVYETGEVYQQEGLPGQMLENGKIVEAYFDALFAPSRNENQDVTGVLVLATIVTDRVRAQQKLEETEMNLREAIEIAELGTWRLDIKTGIISYSKRMQDWYGLSSPDLPGEEFMKMVEEPFRENAMSARRKIETAGTDDLITSEHKVVNKITGQRRMIHSVGKKVLNRQGILVAISGTSRDITEQRERELGLEKEVQLSSEQLAAAYEELQSTNEELSATNDELEQLNSALQKTNDQLAQYAYVASHDLQEPLRKIRTFATYLGEQQDLAPSSREYLEKIIFSATRMSSLIKDLLEFSGLLDATALMRPLDLNDCLLEVLRDFELKLKEAEVEISSLPVVEGVRLQMIQLFQNLISNALKFSDPIRKAKLKVTAREVSKEELLHIMPQAQLSVRYHKICFSDNGIGFDATYAQRIFEVFKRLHGRSVYAGSGIGLAICKRIVDNHNGHIYAISEQGKGSEFIVILPEHRNQSQYL